MQSDNLFGRLGSVLKDYIDDEDLQRHNRAKAAEEGGKKPVQAENTADKVEAATDPDTKTDTVIGNKTAAKGADTAKINSGGKNRSGQGSRTRGIVYKALPIRLLEDFNILGLPPDTDFQTCKKRYKKLLHLYHPDKYEAGSKEQEKASALTMRIHKAFKNIEKFKTRV